MHSSTTECLAETQISFRKIGAEMGDDGTLKLATSMICRLAEYETSQVTNQISNLAVTSLSTRNLLEMLLILNHITHSVDALNSWFAQAYNDLIEVLVAHHARTSRPGNIMSEAQDFAELLKQQLPKGRFDKKFNMKTLAKEQGLHLDYDFAYKLTSKIVHPTSMRVNGWRAFGRSQEWADIVFFLAGRYALELGEIAESNFRKWQASPR